MAPDPTYDVFLSHASPDKPQVEELARRLKRRKLKPFLDRWHLVPGEPWQEGLEEALDQSRTVAVFLGPGDLGPWQNEEMRDALDARARDKSRRVIPVLLPGASMPEKQELPRFLRRLTWVDFRGGLDDPHALHRLVCGIKGIPPEGGPSSAPRLARPTMVGVPHRNPYFTGREELLARLHQQLQTQGISALVQAAIYGLGGIGKTQTAIEYGYRFGEHYRFVLWIGADGESAIRSAYVSIARELGLVEAQADLETAVLKVKDWLSREDGWLLIFDNADDPALVRPYLPARRRSGKVLLTSRAKSFAKVGIREPFRVGILDPEDGVKFLIERVGNADTQAAAELASELGYLPLALEQAAAYMETVGGGFAEYLVRYRRQGLALLERGEPSTDYPKTVATTWKLSFAAVREASPASAELLTAAAFLAPDFIPIEIFTLGGYEFGNLLAQALECADDDSLVFWELLEPLERYSLVERLPTDAFKLHRLTQAVVKNLLSEEEQRGYAVQVVRALNAAHPPLYFWRETELCERLHTQVLQAKAQVTHFKIFEIFSGQLFLSAGLYASRRRNHAAAREFLEQSLEIMKQAPGGDYEHDTLNALYHLGNLLWYLDDIAGQRKVEEQIVEFHDRALSDEHLDTLIPRRKLATGFRTTKPDFARKLYEKNLEICERLLGTEHPDTTNATWDLLLTIRSINDDHRINNRYTINDRDAEIRLIEKLRWLLDRDEDSIPSADQRQVRQWLLDLLNPS